MEGSAPKSKQARPEVAVITSVLPFFLPALHVTKVRFHTGPEPTLHHMPLAPSAASPKFRSAYLCGVWRRSKQPVFLAPCPLVGQSLGRDNP